MPDANIESMWLVLYNCLSELCVDSRPPIRKSACQTLLQTVAAHGAVLQPATWKYMVWQVSFKVIFSNRNAQNICSDSISYA